MSESMEKMGKKGGFLGITEEERIFFGRKRPPSQQAMGMFKGPTRCSEAEQACKLIQKTGILEWRLAQLVCIQGSEGVWFRLLPKPRGRSWVV